MPALNKCYQHNTNLNQWTKQNMRVGKISRKNKYSLGQIIPLMCNIKHSLSFSIKKKFPRWFCNIPAPYTYSRAFFSEKTSQVWELLN